MSEWIKFTGSDEQITEICNAKYGYILRGEYKPGTEACFTYSDRIHDYFVLDGNINNYNVDYWIIPADPLREMKIRQASTGQPVCVLMTEKQYWTMPLGEFEGKVQINGKVIIKTNNPNWTIPNAEYSFTEFKEEYEGNPKSIEWTTYTGEKFAYILNNL